MSRTREFLTIKVAVLCGSVGVLGYAIGITTETSLATMAPPTEHKGLTVEALGHVSGNSMEKQIGLTGYKLQLRRIAIAPGGQIASHSHADKPGLVAVIDGEWVEGRPGGETRFPENGDTAIVEDADTEHWFLNTGTETGTAIVCDIVPDA